MTAVGTDDLDEIVESDRRRTALRSDSRRAAIQPAPTAEYDWLLPDEFWDSRPELQHIRQAARSRMIAPDAVLGGTLVRVASMTHHAVTLPPSVGRRGGQDLFVGIVAAPGVGKGSALDAARDLIPDPLPASHLAGEWLDTPVGSGEGMVAAFFGETTIEDENRKLRKTQTQVRWNAHFRIDEGETLARLATRQDQTTMTVLRQMWSREGLGQRYSDKEKNRQLPPGSYRVGLVMGVQPALAKFLFDDVAGGTPQRFTFLSGNDPRISADVPAWPGPLGWKAPRTPDVRYSMDIAVAEAVVSELRSLHLERVRNGGDELSAHSGLRQLKLAANLAALDGRYEVTDEDWWLASLIMATSDAVRDRALAVVAHEATARDVAAAVRAARIREAELAVEDRHVESRAEKAVSILVKALAKKAEAGNRGPFAWRVLSQSMGSRYKDVMIEARDMALERGLIVESGEAQYCLVVQP